MKKIIDGKLYNTHTAREVDEWCHDRGNYQQYGEGLYCKRTGEYFLWKESYWADRQEIVPLSTKEAQEWMERYSNVDTYAAEWGLPEE